MATTTSGLRYPVSADDPDIPRDIRQLAEDIDNYLNASGSGAFNGVLPVIDINGNSTTSTRLATSRTISLGGSLSGSASFDGSTNITISASNSASPTFTGTVTLPATTSIGNVNATEISYVDGVTSSIQTQLNQKQPLVSGVSDAEIGHLDGVTSAIQTQLNTITTNLSSAVPSGVISQFAGASAPAGYLLCDGTAVSRTTYGSLFTALSTTYGIGDGSTTFNVPNLKGRIPVGRDSAQAEFYALAQTGGLKTHTLTAAEIPSHTHFVTYMGSDLTYGNAALQGSAGGTQTAVNASTGGSNPAGGGAHNNLQPYIVVNYIIKT